MDNEIIFRVWLLILFISFVAHRGYYHRKLNQPEARTIKQPQRELAPALAGLFSLVGLVAVAVYIIYPVWMAWAALPFPIGLRWAGVGLAGLGFIVLQWAQITLDKNWSSAPRLLADQTARCR